MSIWDDLQNSVQQGIQDVKNVGLPALEAQGEQTAINMLTTMQQNASQTAQANAATILNRPSDPNSFMSQLIKNTVQSPALQAYGPYLLVTAVAIGIVSVFIFGGKHHG